MKFNNDTIKNESGVNPIRSYFCISCCGYHLTSKEDRNVKSITEIILEEYNEMKRKKKERKIETKIKKKLPQH